MERKKTENKKIYQDFGSLLGKWRESQGLSGYQVERLTGIRRDTLSRIEKGEGVNAEAFISYLLFARQNGYDPIGKILHDISDAELMKKSNKLIKSQLEEKVPKEDLAEKATKMEDSSIEEEADDDYESALYHYDAALGRLGEEDKNHATGLSPIEQIAILKHGRCPMCGHVVEIKKSKNNKMYLGHVQFSRDCCYYAHGTIREPRIAESFNKNIFPIPGAIYIE